MTEAAASPLEAHLGYWLRFVSNHVSHAFRRRVEGCGVTVAEWVVLRDLFTHSPSAPSTLAARLGMTRGAVSRLVDRLETKELIARHTEGQDRRWQTLTLTPQGRALVPRLSTLADSNDAEFFGHLDPADRATIERAMKEIVQRLGLRAVPVD